VDTKRRKMNQFLCGDEEEKGESILVWRQKEEI
jgi:hypothetical protein